MLVVSRHVAHSREERLAANEAQFRSVNESLAPIPSVEEPQFFCECSAAECVEFINMPEADYLAIHEDPMCFTVKSGHEVLETETIVRQGDGFNVVRKHEDVRHVVDESRP
jgi:hypothetical protein